MLSLILDTSTERGVVAIADGPELLFQKHLPQGWQNSRHLVPAVQEGLKLLRLVPADIRVVGLGIGPGSYTGLRVGAIIGKSFAFACQAQLVGFCSLEGFIPEALGRFSAVYDARTGGIYLLQGEKKEEGISLFSPPRLCPPEEVVEALREYPHLVTPIADRLKIRFPEVTGKWIERAPDLSHLAKIVAQKMEQGEGKASDEELSLLYLREWQPT